MTQPPITDYHYGHEADQYSFYRLPKALFEDEFYKDLSNDAKLLYSMMLDRMSLSMKNNWVDEQGRVFIYFTVECINKRIGCASAKAVKLLAELDSRKGVGLIERIKQGQGRPTIIYVKRISNDDPDGGGKPDKKQNKKKPTNSANADRADNKKNTVDRSFNYKASKLNPPPSPMSPSDFQKSNAMVAELTSNKPLDSETENSTSPPEQTLDCRNSKGNNTNHIKTNFNNTEYRSYQSNLIQTYPEKTDQIDPIESKKKPYKSFSDDHKPLNFFDLLQDNIDFEFLINNWGTERVRALTNLMLETLNSTRPYIRVARESRPQHEVKKRLLEVNASHIEYIFTCMDKNTTEIRNIKAYMLTSLYNAPVTMESYYDALLKCDGYHYKKSGVG